MRCGYSVCHEGGHTGQPREAEMITYRIQQPEHSLDLLLDPETQYSTPGTATRI